MTLDPTTLRETARIMRKSIEGDYPASPQQAGALTATASWASWLEQQAALADAALPKETP